MAEITGKTSDRMAEHEILDRAGSQERIAYRGRLSRLMSIREKLRASSSKVTGFLGIREAHELDERSKQLWTTHSKGQVEKPRSPMDILR